MTPTKYPYLKVLLAYTLSPIATGLVVLVFLARHDIWTAPDLWSVLTTLLTVIIMSFFSTLIAIMVFSIPAFITGGIVCLLQLKKEPIGVLLSTIIGICVMGTIVLLSSEPSWEVPSLAGATAGLVSLWILPNPQKRAESFLE